MISLTEVDHQSANLTLDGELTIYVAENFQQELNAYLSKYKKIKVDMSDVSELDTSCYQVLLRAKLLSKKNNTLFHIGKVSEEAKQVFDIYNLEDIFEGFDTSDSMKG